MKLRCPVAVTRNLPPPRFHDVPFSTVHVWLTVHGSRSESSTKSTVVRSLSPIKPHTPQPRFPDMPFSTVHVWLDEPYVRIYKGQMKLDDYELR